MILLPRGLRPTRRVGATICALLMLAGSLGITGCMRVRTLLPSLRGSMGYSGYTSQDLRSDLVFFADRYFGYDDAIYASLRLLEIVAEAGKPLSSLLADVPTTYSTPELRVDCDDAVKFGVVERVLAHYPEIGKQLEANRSRALLRFVAFEKGEDRIDRFARKRHRQPRHAHRFLRRHEAAQPAGRQIDFLFAEVFSLLGGNFKSGRVYGEPGFAVRPQRLKMVIERPRVIHIGGSRSHVRRIAKHFFAVDRQASVTGFVA